MLFLIRVGTTIPWYGPTGGVGVVIGVTEAKSKEEAVKQLGLIRWDGWKRIPKVDVTNWKKWCEKYFYTSFDTKGIDRSPEKYASANWRMRVITLERMSKLDGLIPGKIWRQF